MAGWGCLVWVAYSDFADRPFETIYVQARIEFNCVN